MKDIKTVEILRVGNKPNYTDFEKGDLVTITTRNPHKYLIKYTGRIDLICNTKLLLDYSKNFESYIKEFYYDEIESIRKYIPD